MKKGILITLVIVLLLVGGSFSFLKGTYNTMVDKNEVVEANWGQVENVYQRRMDLIPNLVNTVKGYADHEKDTFSAVAEARSKAGGVMQLNAEDLKDPKAIERFQQAQSSLGGTLQRLMMLQERYPDLKANTSFLKLQDELAGTENRIAIERRRFNESAKELNSYIKKFPQVILANSFGFTPRAYFKATAGADKAPKVDFGN
ncbi:MAG: LemA family protein [Candidatus Cloacimonetes bacterium 4572_65]|nr:MAG: LemA family protein [Candidatus Cloacimonetes bacterium 4572_65]